MSRERWKPMLPKTPRFWRLPRRFRLMNPHFWSRLLLSFFSHNKLLLVLLLFSFLLLLFPLFTFQCYWGAFQQTHTKNIYWKPKIYERGAPLPPPLGWIEIESGSNFISSPPLITETNQKTCISSAFSQFQRNLFWIAESSDQSILISRVCVLLMCSFTLVTRSSRLEKVIIFLANRFPWFSGPIQRKRRRRWWWWKGKPNQKLSSALPSAFSFTFDCATPCARNPSTVHGSQENRYSPLAACAIIIEETSSFNDDVTMASGGYCVLVVKNFQATNFQRSETHLEKWKVIVVERHRELP